jgi:hypothetical protein
MNMPPTRVAECLACVRACVRACCYYSIVPAEYMFRATFPKDSGCSCIPREQEFFLQSGSHRKYQFVKTKNFLCIGLHQQHLFDLLHDICGGSWSGNIPNAIPVFGRQAACLKCQWRGKRLFISIRRQCTDRQLKTGERLKSITLTYRLLANLVPHLE